MNKIIPILLAGGMGTRLSPISSESNPKQFLYLNDQEDSFFQAALKRSILIASPEDIIVVGSVLFDKLLLNQLNQVCGSVAHELLFEPYPRNTAPAVIIAALQATELYGDPILWISPTDHVIDNPFKLVTTVNECADMLDDGQIILFGVEVNNIDKNYGYFVCEKNTQSSLVKINKFIEKPELSILKQLLKEKNCFINSGMILTKASTLLREVNLVAPDLLKNIREAYNNLKTVDGISYIAEHYYKEIASISIDKLLIEKTSSLYNYPLNVGWRDIGSWESMIEFGISSSNNELIFNKRSIDSNYESTIISTSMGNFSVNNADGKVVVKKKELI